MKRRCAFQMWIRNHFIDKAIVLISFSCKAGIIAVRRKSTSILPS